MRELDRAADRYSRLGFQVGPRNQHPWGTDNRLIQFGSSFIELIAVGKNGRQIPSHQQRQFSFGAFVRDFLERQEGIAMVVLNSADAQSDASRFADLGIGDFEPFFFERTGRRPDGSETHVAFTLAFARDPAAPGLGFFACQQQFPENFWNTNFQQHANTATDIAAVTLRTSDPNQHAKFLTGFTRTEKQCLPDGLKFSLDCGRLEILASVERPKRTLPLPTFSSCSVQVQELETVAGLLRERAIAFTASADEIVLPSSLLFGVELRFETAGA